VQTFTSGDFTSTVNDSLIVGLLFGTAGATYDMTDGATYNEVLDQDISGAHAGTVYKILTATATEDWDLSTAPNNESVPMMAFVLNGAAGGGGGTARNMTLRGVGP
jgi:hypothetical protein